MELITEINQIQEGDILYLIKINETMTNKAQMENIVIVQADIHDELYVDDYGGYTSKAEPMGMLYIKTLFEKWISVYKVDNIYTANWNNLIKIANKKYDTKE